MSTELENKSSVYPLSRLSAQITPVDQSLVIAEASKTLGIVAQAKLKLILKQIEYLQSEARHIIESTRNNMMIHTASCAFTKRAGHIYHLYRRSALETDIYLSMLSPEEWGNPPHEYLGSYKLEEDMTWLKVEILDEDDS